MIDSHEQRTRLPALRGAGSPPTEGRRATTSPVGPARRPQAPRDPMTSAQLTMSLPFIPAALWPETGQ
jgi:hypothetical protein